MEGAVIGIQQSMEKSGERQSSQCRGKVDDFRKMCYVQAVTWSRGLSEGFNHRHGHWSAHWHSKCLRVRSRYQGKGSFWILC